METAPTSPPEADVAAAPTAPARAFLPWIEAARTVLMAGVVLVHVNSVMAQDVARWWPAGAWSCLLFALMVPSFFFVSGFVIGLADPGPQAPFDARRFVRRRVVTLVVPFVAWNAIMVAFDLAVGRGFMVSRDDPNLAGSIAFRLLTGFWQLYFIAALLQCLALWLACRRSIARHPLAWLVGAGLVSAAFYALASYGMWSGWAHAGVMEDYLDRTLFPWFFVFLLGVCFGRSPRARAWLCRGWWLIGGAA